MGWSRGDSCLLRVWASGDRGALARGAAALGPPRGLRRWASEADGRGAVDGRCACLRAGGCAEPSICRPALGAAASDPVVAGGDEAERISGPAGDLRSSLLASRRRDRSGSGDSRHLGVADAVRPGGGAQRCIGWSGRSTRLRCRRLTDRAVASRSDRPVPRRRGVANLRGSACREGRRGGITRSRLEERFVALPRRARPASAEAQRRRSRSAAASSRSTASGRAGGLSSSSTAGPLTAPVGPSRKIASATGFCLPKDGG